MSIQPQSFASGKSRQRSVLLFDLAHRTPSWAALEHYTASHERWDFTFVRGLEQMNWYLQDIPERFDGLIGQPVFDPHLLELLRASGLPSVAISQTTKQPWVSTDNHMAGRLAAEHLYERGYRWGTYFVHQRLVEGAPLVVLHRRDGFVQRFQELGGEVYPCLGGISRPDLLEAWLADAPKPVGVLVGISEFAGQFYQACKHLRLRVPNEVAIIASGMREYIDWSESWPSLSLVEEDVYSYYYAGAELLDRLMSGLDTAGRAERVIPPLSVTPGETTDILLHHDPHFIDAVYFIRNHCCDGIKPDDVLNEVPINRRTLERRIKETYGMTLERFIYRERIEHVKRMIRDSRMPLVEIAAATGFSSQPLLNKIFKRETGMTPRQFSLEKSENDSQSRQVAE